MDNKVTKDNKIELFICIIISLSIFSIYIPIDTGGYLMLIMWFVQIVIPIVFGFVIKEQKNFYICTVTLALSNILSSIITWIWVQNEIETVRQSVKNYGSVFIIAAYGVVAYLSIIFTAFVCLECIIYMIIKHRKSKKENINS